MLFLLPAFPLFRVAIFDLSRLVAACRAPPPGVAARPPVVGTVAAIARPPPAGTASHSACGLTAAPLHTATADGARLPDSASSARATAALGTAAATIASTQTCDACGRAGRPRREAAAGSTAKGRGLGRMQLQRAQPHAAAADGRRHARHLPAEAGGLPLAWESPPSPRRRSTPPPSPYA